MKANHLVKTRDCGWVRRVLFIRSMYIYRHETYCALWKHETDVTTLFQ